MDQGICLCFYGKYDWYWVWWKGRHNQSIFHMYDDCMFKKGFLLQVVEDTCTSVVTLNDEKDGSVNELFYKHYIL